MPKKPFSGKQKKEQLKAKRERITLHKSRADQEDNVIKIPDNGCKETRSEITEEPTPIPARQPLIPIIPKDDKRADPNRYKLQFGKETKEELHERSRLARLPLQVLGEKDLERDFENASRSNNVLDMPKRPPWDYNLTRNQVEKNEIQYFRNYVEAINKEYRNSKDPPSYFDLNLETWRQLWRVLEIADVVLLIVDVRYIPIHFPPSLFDHVTRDLSKQLILVINKVDLAPASLVARWIRYTNKRFPGVRTVCFSSCPLGNDEEAKMATKNLHRKRRKRPISDAGPRQLVQVCQDIVQNQVDLSSWMKKIENDELEERESEEEDEEEEEDYEVENGKEKEEIDSLGQAFTPFKNGTLRIGCCGFPNVGKSSVMNALIGKKVVSVSKTPGHTKHFQTYYLTHTVMLCDCPGLVFPSQIERPLQVLAGMFPVAQVQEPYTVVGFLASHVDLPSILKIDHPDDESVWSAMDICDAWAEKRGFMTAKGARHDVYKAANELLRLSIEGKLYFCFRPPDGDEDCTEIGDLSYENILERVEKTQRAKLSSTLATAMPETAPPKGACSEDILMEGESEDESGTSDVSAVAAGGNMFALLEDEDN